MAEALDQSVDDQFPLVDWCLVDKFAENNFVNSSDDESIEIIERVSLRPVTPASSSGNESENEQEDYEDIKSETSASNENIQTSDLSEFYSCVELSEDTSRPDILNSVSWKIFYSFTLAAFASLVIHQYKEYFIGKWNYYNESFKIEINDPTDLAVELPFPLTKPDLYSMKNSFIWLQKNIIANDEINDLTIRLKNKIEESKIILDYKFESYVELLKNIKQLEKNVYVLNVSELNRKSLQQHLLASKSIFDISSSIDKILLCPANIETKELPYMCKDNQDTFIIFTENNLLSVYESIDDFLKENNEKFNNFDDNIVKFLTKKSVKKKHGKPGKESHNSFVPDCDNFSKHYKSNDFCFKTNTMNCVKSSKNKNKIKASVTPDAGNEKTATTVNYKVDQIITKANNENSITPKIEEKSNVENKFNLDTFSEIMKTKRLNTVNSVLNDDSKRDDGNNINRGKLMQELKNFMKKFKYDFENFYKMYIAVETMEEYGQTSDSPNISNKLASNATENVVADENSSENNVESMENESVTNTNSKPVSGEWFFKLSNAREKLRNYYDRAVSGDWILKLGKAREKLRETFQEKDEEKKEFDEEDKKKESDKNEWSFKDWVLKLGHARDEIRKKFQEKWFHEKYEKKGSEKIKEHWENSREWLRKGQEKLKKNLKKMKDGFQHNYEKFISSDWQNYVPTFEFF